MRIIKFQHPPWTSQSTQQGLAPSLRKVHRQDLISPKAGHVTTWVRNARGDADRVEVFDGFDSIIKIIKIKISKETQMAFLF